MTDESGYESARRQALAWWRSTLAPGDQIDDEASQRFAAEYAAYIDELPSLRFPDSPPLSPADYADGNLI